jgi:hypothetical protein
MTAAEMITQLRQGWALEGHYLPHYSQTQQIIGTTILAAILVITVLTFVIIHCRRGR